MYTNCPWDDIFLLLASHTLYWKKLECQFPKIFYLLNLVANMTCNLALSVMNIFHALLNISLFLRYKVFFLISATLCYWLNSTFFFFFNSKPNKIHVFLRDIVEQIKFIWFWRTLMCIVYIPYIYSVSFTFCRHASQFSWFSYYQNWNQ